ncbi:hypothetical protein DQ384_00115 [Sphaerisporangium album]|uniref:Uncharacterized protein n=1 Tax=Sphaerisporangium album TaxID=509200 RepID=A0A367FSL5_9ACTN|nr:hypothetical protein DQ384_00115 [Sphaerisporangium album]
MISAVDRGRSPVATARDHAGGGTPAADTGQGGVPQETFYKLSPHSARGNLFRRDDTIREWGHVDVRDAARACRPPAGAGVSAPGA